jgi:hypothetical protein
MPSFPNKRCSGYKVMMRRVRSKSSLAECQKTWEQYITGANALRAREPHEAGSVGTCLNPLPIEHSTEIDDAVVAAAGASRNALAKMQWFLDMGGSVNSDSSNAHKSALAWSISARNQDCFELLMEKGAFVGSSECTGGVRGHLRKHGQTGRCGDMLLHVSQKTMCKLARRKRADDPMSLFFAQKLVGAGASINDLDKNGHTALQCAVMGGHVLAATFLINKAPRHLHDRCDQCGGKGLIHHVGNACPDSDCFYENCDVAMLLLLVVTYHLSLDAVYFEAGRRQGLSLCDTGREALRDQLPGRVPALEDFLVSRREPTTPAWHLSRVGRRKAVQESGRLAKAARHGDVNQHEPACDDESDE